MQKTKGKDMRVKHAHKQNAKSHIDTNECMHICYYEAFVLCTVFMHTKLLK